MQQALREFEEKEALAKEHCHFFRKQLEECYLNKEEDSKRCWAIKTGLYECHRDITLK